MVRIKDVEPDVYLVTASDFGGGQHTSLCRLTQHGLPEGNVVQGISFDDESFQKALTRGELDFFAIRTALAKHRVTSEGEDE